ncbi:exodeoxyribonuclease 7 large subunit [Tepiditoga spiralis]|uniref:Exodeoxyribonuclease 7 large subunit n=1 Tax=Tepiditoga spiralis TaxID=2108365 RepID=A0A7G1GA84_9BACT|nr:exodeoxyribonuclease VII large subunit [Tepiditoga spiralis]BBE31993.1 exodeoxyribonuclease 7 large subunit [Tepiditoga spiralis]
MFFQEKILEFKTLSELLDYLTNFYKRSEIYNTSVIITGDITSAKKSKNGDLYLEISQRDKNTNYSLTVFFSKLMIPYLLKRLNLNNERELLNKKWKIEGTLQLWKYNAKFVLNGSSIIPFGNSEIDKKKKEILLKLKKENLINKNQNSLLDLEPIKKIAIITSPTAAGYGDFKKNIQYAKNIPIIHLYSSSMQGAKTVPNILKALSKIKKSKINYDVVVITRGGGSKSDLIYFDNFNLGKEIALFKIPILSAIGHEQDTTIPDYTSWKRYSTPTEVSRDIVNQINYFNDILLNLEKNLKVSFNFFFNIFEQNTVKNFKSNSNYLFKEIINYNKKINNISTFIKLNLERSTKEIVLPKVNFLKNFFHKDIEKEIKNLNKIFIKNDKYFSTNILMVENKFTKVFSKLTENSPFSAFLSGGAVVKKSKKIIKSIDELEVNDEVDILFKDGNAKAKIKQKEV